MARCPGCGEPVSQRGLRIALWLAVAVALALPVDPATRDGLLLLR